MTSDAESILSAEGFNLTKRNVEVLKGINALWRAANLPGEVTLENLAIFKQNLLATFPDALKAAEKEAQERGKISALDSLRADKDEVIKSKTETIESLKDTIKTLMERITDHEKTIARAKWS